MPHHSPWRKKPDTGLKMVIVLIFSTCKICQPLVPKQICRIGSVGSAQQSLMIFWQILLEPNNHLTEPKNSLHTVLKNSCIYHVLKLCIFQKTKEIAQLGIDYNLKLHLQNPRTLRKYHKNVASCLFYESHFHDESIFKIGTSSLSGFLFHIATRDIRSLFGISTASFCKSQQKN